MDLVTQKKKAKEFVKRWKAAEGNEQREANSFWTELCQEVLGIPNPTHVLDFERKVRGKRIDVFYEDHSILIENKSRGVDLDKKEQRGKNNDGTPRMVTPYEQARWYADYITPRSVAPKYILTCNFDEIRIYDTDEEYPERTFETIHLEELPNLLHRLSFFTQKENSRAERETNLSVSAGEVVGKLYDAFSKSYLDIENNEDEQRSLNMLITRIVFLLYAEDSGNLKVRNQFYNYMSNYQTAHMRNALRDLFLVLNTEEDKRDPYLPEELADFPYINGGLFKDEIIIPQFTDEARYILLKEASSEFDWASISPTIFGAVFESTLTAKKRREGGMHYTSVENIHKVTGPLFYDDLKNELTTIEGIKTHKERQFKLRKFREKLASIHVLDPACGSGNFLTETYLSFRKLENRVLEDLRYDQVEGQMTLGQMDPIMVSLDQFYGIEIDDFAVSVAKTALWIAQLQMTLETSEVMGEWIAPLPLKSNENIVCGNALRMDWNDVLPAEKCHYIIGNPPFIGQDGKTDEQKRDMILIWGEKSDGYLDYVTAWYKKTVDYYSKVSNGAFAFVSTNSICQGEPVASLFRPLFDMGWRISFAWPTFVWTSEAIDKASVHVVVVGMDRTTGSAKLFYSDKVETVDQISPYLYPGDIVFIEKNSTPISNVLKPAVYGSKPADGGFLQIKTEEEYNKAMSDAIAAKYVRRALGATELINGKQRWCLWLEDASPEEISESTFLSERVKACREWRQKSKKKQTKEAAQFPHLFAEMRKIPEKYLCLPRHFSGERNYFISDFVEDGAVATDACFIIEDLDGFAFSLISSKMFMLWQDTVGGRLKSDNRFANTLVWNTFPVPVMSDEQRHLLIIAGDSVIQARRNHPSWSLAQLYDPDKMPDDLREAHEALDKAVEAAYGVDFNGDEEKIVAHLFKLYEQAIKAEGDSSPKEKKPSAKEDAKPSAIKVKVKKKAR
ncbi:MAG: class I SAM-dependent DNA methyltransferase [Clostridia bacterium]|nr:class I SAM-dependent DNA methyltransferase [Clostridia bacterium]